MDSRVSARTLSATLTGWRTREPAYEALADAIRLLCLDNRLAARTALPAERELAAVLGLSRTTVAAAYRSLRESGHIESRRGAGSVTLAQASREPGRVAVEEDDIDLQQASPSAWPGLAGVIAEAAQDAAVIVARAGYDVCGSRALREAIASRYCEQGVPTRADEVMVTTGAQAAISLLAQTLSRRGDRVVIETPTYPHAADSFRRVGARLVGLPVSPDAGWDLERAEQAFSRTRPGVAYLMPRYQNPTGQSMDAQTEEALIRAATVAGTTVILDETTADLVIDGPVLPPAFARFPVVRIGSLGKTVWGGLRIGWIRADAALVRQLVAARPAFELGTADFEQAVAVRLVERMPEILLQRSQLLRDGRATVMAALEDRLPQWRMPRPEGGVSLWLELDAPLSSALVMAARARGVFLSAGARFSVDGALERYLRVPFTAPADELRRAVDILADVWTDVRAAAPSASAGRELARLPDALV